MHPWAQHIAVLLIVAACLGVVAWQALGTLFGRKSRLGSCCSKGCTTEPPKPDSSEKIVFMPVEMLSHRKP